MDGGCFVIGVMRIARFDYTGFRPVAARTSVVQGTGYNHVGCGCYGSCSVIGVMLGWQAAAIGHLWVDAGRAAGVLQYKTVTLAPARWNLIP